MKVGTILASELGQACWLAYKAHQCVGCGFYESCSYPDRFCDPEYDRLIAEVRELKSALLKAQLKKAAYAAGSHE